MIILNGASLTLDTLVRIARDHEVVAIDDASKVLVEASSAFVGTLEASDEPIYGINTGFGHLAHVKS